MWCIIDVYQHYMCLNHPSDRWSDSKWLRAPNHAHHVVHGVQVAAGTQRHVCVDQVVYQAQDLRRQVLKGKCGFNQQKVVNLRLRENVLARFSREKNVDLTKNGGFTHKIYGGFNITPDRKCGLHQLWGCNGHI